MRRGKLEGQEAGRGQMPEYWIERRAGKISDKDGSMSMGRHRPQLRHVQDHGHGFDHDAIANPSA